MPVLRRVKDLVPESFRKRVLLPLMLLPRTMTGRFMALPDFIIIGARNKEAFRTTIE